MRCCGGQRRAIGSDLLVCVGSPHEKILEVMKSCGADSYTILAQSEVTYEEIRTEKRLRSAIQASSPPRRERTKTPFWPFSAS